jgi:hypothetical protein
MQHNSGGALETFTKTRPGLRARFGRSISRLVEVSDGMLGVPSLATVAIRRRRTSMRGRVNVWQWSAL